MNRGGDMPARGEIGKEETGASFESFYSELRFGAGTDREKGGDQEGAETGSSIPEVE